MTKKNVIIIVVVMMISLPLTILLFYEKNQCHMNHLLENVLTNTLAGGIVGLPMICINVKIEERKERLKIDTHVKRISEIVFGFDSSEKHELQYVLSFQNDLMIEVNYLRECVDSRVSTKHNLLANLEYSCVKLNLSLSVLTRHYYVDMQKLYIQNLDDKTFKALEDCKQACKNLGFDYSLDGINVQPFK